MTRRTFFRFLTVTPTALLVPAMVVGTPTPAAAMTLVQAKAVAGSIVDANFDAVETKQPDGTWQVRGRSGLFNIPASQVASLATSNGVSAMVSEALFF